MSAAAASTAASAAKAAKAAQVANIAAIGLEATASTIIAIDDAAKRRKAMLALQTLNQREQRELENSLARASTVTQRIAMLGNLIARQRIAIMELEQKKQLQRAMIIGGGIVGVVIIAVAAKYLSR